jgi:hypothetical protein
MYNTSPSFCSVSICLIVNMTRAMIPWHVGRDYYQLSELIGDLSIIPLERTNHIIDLSKLKTLK